jgi:hypothetical protein
VYCFQEAKGLYREAAQKLFAFSLLWQITGITVKMMIGMQAMASLGAGGMGILLSFESSQGLSEGN